MLKNLPIYPEANKLKTEIKSKFKIVSLSGSHLQFNDIISNELWEGEFRAGYQSCIKHTSVHVHNAGQNQHNAFSKKTMPVQSRYFLIFARINDTNKQHKQMQKIVSISTQ